MQEPLKVTKCNTLCPVVHSRGQYVAASTRLWCLCCLCKPPAQSGKAGVLYSGGLSFACTTDAFLEDLYTLAHSSILFRGRTSTPQPKLVVRAARMCHSRLGVGSPVNRRRVLVTAQTTHIPTSWNVAEGFVWLLSLKVRSDRSGGWSGWEFLCGEI